MKSLMSQRFWLSTPQSWPLVLKTAHCLPSNSQNELYLGTHCSLDEDIGRFYCGHFT